MSPLDRKTFNSPDAHFWKGNLENQQNTIAFITGNVVAFVVAMLAIRFFINYCPGIFYDSLPANAGYMFKYHITDISCF